VIDAVIDDSWDFPVIAVEGIDGAGKSSLCERLAAALGGPPAALVTRLSPHGGALVREMVEGPGEPGSGPVRYQDVVPPGLRRAVYTVDALAQFHYLGETYRASRAVLFDRWLPTYEVYCGPFDTHAGWYEAMAALIPRPAALIHLRVDPEVALERLTARGDWTARHWSEAALLADLRRLDAAYGRVMAGLPHVALDGNAPADAVTGAALALVERALGGASRARPVRGAPAAPGGTR
jgi:thymidylate kinase